MPQMDTATAPAATAAGPTAAHSLIDARLSKIEDVARDTKLYTFERVDGGKLPGYKPGAHIDLHLPNGLLRQFSLTVPAENPDSYTVGVPYGDSWINLTPTVDDAAATITIGSNPATSGTAANEALQVGAHVFTVVVVAEDGTTTRTYTVTVNRDAEHLYWVDGQAESIVQADLDGSWSSQPQVIRCVPQVEHRSTSHSLMWG